jgi:hypothetical protein
LNEALDIAIDKTFDFATQWTVWIEVAVVLGTREDAASH